MVSRRDSTECAAGSAFYVCNINGFRGCCPFDPCASTDACLLTTSTFLTSISSTVSVSTSTSATSATSATSTPDVSQISPLRTASTSATATALPEHSQPEDMLSTLIAVGATGAALVALLLAVVIGQRHLYHRRISNLKGSQPLNLHHYRRANPPSVQPTHQEVAEDHPNTDLREPDVSHLAELPATPLLGSVPRTVTNSSAIATLSPLNQVLDLQATQTGHQSDSQPESSARSAEPHVEHEFAWLRW